MDEQATQRPEQSDHAPAQPYEPPTITRWGHVAAVAGQKEVGAADGTAYLGVDVGDVFS